MTQIDTSRRGFLKSAVAASAAMMSAAAVHAGIPAKSVAKYDETFDVVIIGSGFAGMACALKAGRAGLKVLMIEKMSTVGGNSAICGGNVACPTLRTTNDMPIAEPPSFNTFGFIPFQTNPHFISAAGTSGLNNETREDRLEEFLWYNKDEEVIGLPEGIALFVTGEHDCEVIGPKDAEALYWFRQAEMGMRLERIALGTKFDLRKIVPGGKL